MTRPVPLPREAEALGLSARQIGRGADAPISATPFLWTDPRTIPPRGWVYGWHYIRQFVSATVAPGGVGKSSLTIVEALAIATGRPLLGITPHERVRTWLWNAEDPIEELQRRVMAAALHFGIQRDEIEGWLFLDSGRSSPIVVVEETPVGTKVAGPIVTALEATIRENRIGVLIVDPFVGTHRVSENDNSKIQRAVEAFAAIADRTHAAIELVHHTRKTAAGAEITVEDGRGAVALLAAARAARAINQMTPDEETRWGVENRRRFFRYYDGKANLAPPAEASTWFHLVSVDLGNETAGRPADSVAVVERWDPPGALDGFTVDHLMKVREGVDEADPPYRASAQSKERWVGLLVAEVAGLDLDDKTDLANVKGALKAWYDSGALRKVTGEWRDASNQLRPIVRSGPLPD